ncbi:carboxylating nicotinate-nucleotide diphosphorylase [Gloeobacter kilaueensis]|uniref:Probable nicotinate-nucleotide pyrophosphorylase [carboxylating] n=1 Tax=Gloeobacter kilaueensis (strain ATCC BAA-2537 / CCAP 1431/1 / ULC 316 / JS1) TaxID=1183438 RepID=U5QCD4_GLOK1|nr:carboxylating nicotinate-nucleotide diphosphorylase [Gloeobacter kilaueensis]AGY56577.1 nicotinate-nucleotide pyrophosphorylase [Gloeobacter kilaueensis JS1]
MIANPFNPPQPLVIDPLLRSWLAEDWGRGDLTSETLFNEHNPLVTGQILLKDTGVIAGLPIVQRLFAIVDERVRIAPVVSEGAAIEPGTIVAVLEGPVRSVLMGERVALNLLQRLSGIATQTRRYVERLVGSTAQLVDTRKTTPGLRLLEKYAVRVGGALNHRFGLDDAAMIKDNHILAAGGIRPAIERLRGRIPFLTPIEVETESLIQVEEALACGVQVIMLDNMPLELMRRAVLLIHRRALTEASGNITLETIAAVAETGVDYISTSATITRAPWLDISLDLTL